LKKTVVIHQPDFLPYLGFFHRFINADLWVILDNVQYLNRGWHSRDQIKVNNGSSWLKVATKKTPRNTLINQVQLANTNWKNDNINLISHNYNKTAFYHEIMPCIEELYSFECINLIDFNLKSIDMLCNLFDISIPQIIASNLNPEGKSNELLINILKKVDAKIYLSGVGAKTYMQDNLFADAGIEIIYQSYTPPVYPQLYGDFIPNLSAIDILFNCGIQKSREILRSI